MTGGGFSLDPPELSPHVTKTEEGVAAAVHGREQAWRGRDRRIRTLSLASCCHPIVTGGVSQKCRSSVATVAAPASAARGVSITQQRTTAAYFVPVDRQMYTMPRERVDTE